MIFVYTISISTNKSFNAIFDLLSKSDTNLITISNNFSRSSSMPLFSELLLNFNILEYLKEFNKFLNISINVLSKYVSII